MVKSGVGICFSPSMNTNYQILTLLLTITTLSFKPCKWGWGCLTYCWHRAVKRLAMPTLLI